MLKCSFTGHRIIPSYHKAAVEALICRGIEYAYSVGCREFFTGGALGFDTAAAKSVLNFKISHPDVRLIIVVPCKNQSEKWNDSQKRIYEYLLCRADEIVYTSEEYTSSCMKRRNEYLADVCDLMIAYTDGGRSGSGQTVRLAEKYGKKVYNLYTRVENSANIKPEEK